MRKFPVLLLILLFSRAAYSGSYGDALVEYYGFEIYQYNGNYQWCWRNPETGVRIFHQWNRDRCDDPQLLEDNPIIVTYRISDNTPVFWVYVPYYDAWGGYSEDKLLTSQSTFNTYQAGLHPLDEVNMQRWGLRTTHPDEYTPPEPPAPGGEDGGDPVGDYGSQLQTVIYYLSVIASTLGLFLGLFVWRLVVLAKCQREL